MSQTRTPPLTHHPLLWDALIAALIILPPLAAGWMITALPGPFGLLLGGLLIVGTATVVYGSFMEPQRLILNKKIIHVSALPELKILIAADFHVGPYRDAEDVARVVETINAQHPDLILLPGDFLFDHRSDIRALEPLKQLRARYGAWACIGNHDSGDHATLRGTRFNTGDRSDEVTAFLKDCGITVLRDTWETVDGPDGPFAIAGTDDPWGDSMDLETALAGLPEDLPLILLAHTPDVVLQPLHRRADLIVCGHTHGGQIRLPGIGALHIPAATGRTYDRGVFPLGDRTTLVVTQGCGETLARARLLCPPEVMEMRNEKRRVKSEE